MSKPHIVVATWLPDGRFEELSRRFTDFAWTDGRAPANLEAALPAANIFYGLPPLPRLAEASQLRWIQLISAGVPHALCPLAQDRSITVTNLAGLYGSSIAEHAFALLLCLARNLHLAFRNQQQGAWDRSIARTMMDLHGRTLALVGLGDIGRAIARLGRAQGMRVVGCRRRDLPAPEVDQVYPLSRLHEMLAEADAVLVAAPLTAHTEGLLGPDEFAAMKPGVLYINVSRGPIAQEAALMTALQSGQVRGAGLDVFATEPLPPNHPFWTMPHVLLSPHYSGETINQSARPAERFARNLIAWRRDRPLEGLVDLAQGY
jgi:phosphoglycerate dehydrogenase-like enzyme